MSWVACKAYSSQCENGAGASIQPSDGTLCNQTPAQAIQAARNRLSAAWPPHPRLLPCNDDIDEVAGNTERLYLRAVCWYTTLGLQQFSNAAALSTTLCFGSFACSLLCPHCSLLCPHCLLLRPHCSALPHCSLLCPHCHGLYPVHVFIAQSSALKCSTPLMEKQRCLNRRE